MTSNISPETFEINKKYELVNDGFKLHISFKLGGDVSEICR